MYQRIIFIILFSFIASADDLSLEQTSLLNKLSNKNNTGVLKDYKIPPKRFKYTKNSFATQKFTTVLKKNSLIQTLDGKKNYKTASARVLKAEEVSIGSPFSFLFNKEGKAVFICYSRDLKKLDNKVSLTPKKVSFVRDIVNYKSVDNDQQLLLNLLVSRGNHTYDIFPEKETLSSMGITSEFGLKNNMLIPMMGVISLNQVTGQSLKWSFANLGLKVSHFWRYNEKTEIGFFAQAEKTIYGQAVVFDQSISLQENRFSIGPIIKWKDNLISLELAQVRLIFPNNALLNTNGITNTDKYHRSFIFKIGKQFEINL